jgi:predicted transcriptional regulator
MDGYVPDYCVLAELGLPPLSISCYAGLFEHGPATAAQLARRLGKHSRTGLYEVLTSLMLAGFVIQTKCVGASIYSALPLHRALALHHAMQRLAVNDLIQYQQSRAATIGNYI